jgi:predicted N-acetyltransferase YhbS
MLRALATHPDHFGKGIGGFTVSEAIGQCSGDPSFLDCVSESLPSFYNRQGFEAIGKQIRSYPDEVQPYNITLMRHSPICDVL